MNTEIHRLLDEAFAGVTMTPEVQDLKEEVRANLLARVAELEAAGHAPDTAARRAIDELGDVHDLLGDADDGARATSSGTAHTDYARHKVRPKPGFVVRAVVWSLMAVVGIALGVLGATGALPLPVGLEIALLGIAAGGIALLVGDSLSQETTTNHPVPRSRAAGYSLASFLGAWGLGLGALVALAALPTWTVVLAALGVIAGIILFAFLGATQTNRHKAWLRQVQRDTPANRFETEPETAARFGIYTVVIWVVAFAVIVALGLTVGWWWSLLAFVGGFAAMLLLLARMMFGSSKG